MAIWSSLISLGSTALGGLFKFKKAQADAVMTAVNVVSDVNSSNGQREAAIATIIAAEASSGFWLSSQWRPLLMVFFAAMIGSFWFGYTPSNLEGPMPPMMQELFTILKIGIGGYIPARTLEKIVHSLNIGSILKKFIEKKVL